MLPSKLPDPRTDETNRLPVWRALSDLFLDTEISEAMIANIAETLHSAPYSLEECEYIFWHEVYPVCIYNLYSVAGEWVCFDEEWLASRILSRAQHVPQWWTFPRWLQCGRWMVRTEWEQVLVVYRSRKPLS